MGFAGRCVWRSGERACVGTGYEVGGWGERHGALNGGRALRERDLLGEFLHFNLQVKRRLH